MRNIPQIKAKPALVAQKILGLKGKPFSLKGRPYLQDIYNTSRARCILKFGRQSEKSTTIAAKMAVNSSCIPYFNTLFVSSSQSQTKDFVSDKLGPFLKESDFIGDYLWDTSMIDRNDQKSLLNGSNIYLRYAFHNADRTRGLSADQVFIDEVQDIRTDNIAVIEECASHSERGINGHPYKSFLYSGTPKSYNNSIEFFWGRSTKKEWGIKCEGCGKWALELGEQNIGKDYLICAKCGHRLYPQTGRWIITNPGAAWEGFHVCQLQVPWLDWHEDILYKLENYPPYRFYNEVLGLSYDSGAKPLKEEDMRRCCNPDIVDWMGYDDPKLPHPCFAGIDWALTAEKSYTILTIGTWLPYPNKFKVLLQKKYEGREADLGFQERDIKEKCELYNAQIIGADWGAGVQQNLRLKEHFGQERVAQFYNAGNQKDRMKWNAKRDMFTISRTTCMTDMFHFIQKGKVEFPTWELYKPFAKDFLNIDIEYNKDGVLYYDHNPDLPDDSAHSTMYCMLAGHLFYTGSP